MLKRCPELPARKANPDLPAPTGHQERPDPLDLPVRRVKPDPPARLARRARLELRVPKARLGLKGLPDPKDRRVLRVSLPQQTVRSFSE
jgi:hypothetical protein